SPPACRSGCEAPRTSSASRGTALRSDRRRGAGLVLRRTPVFHVKRRGRPAVGGHVADRYRQPVGSEHRTLTPASRVPTPRPEALPQPISATTLTLIGMGTSGCGRYTT